MLSIKAGLSVSIDLSLYDRGNVYIFWQCQIFTVHQLPFDDMRRCTLAQT